MDSLLQILEVLLMGLVGDDDFAAWQDHINILELLRADSHTEEDMRQLQQLIPAWKSKIFALFNSVSETTQHSTRQASDRSNRNQVINSSRRARQPRPLNLLNVPNFETLSHVPEQIAFLGPMWFQDTLLFEQRHLLAKRLCLITNQQSNERDVLYKVRSFKITFVLILPSHTAPTPTPTLSESPAFCRALRDASL
jgi:hypothetical protein